MIGCSIKSLPPEKMVEWMLNSNRINPLNSPRKLGTTEFTPARIALLTTAYWSTGGVKLGVGFMENTTVALQNKILSYMNLWGKTANVKFMAASPSTAEVRISRGQGGYYSYLGTQILHVPKGQQTLNLEQFVLSTPDSEYMRVVTHETGHTLGFPHEHLRPDLVKLLNVQKTIAYFERTQGWSESDVRTQVLTPLSESSLMGTPVDVDSIMCYALPGEITLSGQPIPGGTQIDPSDAAFAAKVYPLPSVPTPPIIVPPTPPVNPPVTTSPPIINMTKATLVLSGTNLSLVLDGKTIPFTPASANGDSFMPSLTGNIKAILDNFKGLSWTQLMSFVSLVDSLPVGTIDSLVSVAQSAGVPGSAIFAVLWAHKADLVNDYQKVKEAIDNLISIFQEATASGTAHALGMAPNEAIAVIGTSASDVPAE